MFSGLTEAEMHKQAQALYDNLTEDAINEIMKASGFAEDVYQTIREGLIGRRAYLVDRFDLDTKAPSPEAIEKKPETGSERLRALFASLESKEIAEIFPRTSMLADGDSIENQQIDVIKNQNGLEVTFKLTAAKYKEILTAAETIFTDQQSDQSASPYKIEKTKLSYEGEYPLYISDAYSMTLNGIKIEISTSKSREYGYDMDVRSALGLIRIHIPKEIKDPEHASKQVDKMIGQILEIDRGLELPDESAEKTHAEARYKWHHKVDSAPDAIESKLTREEVMPGYFTMVEKGKAQEYAKKSEFAIYHSIGSYEERLLKILNGGGLLATHERFRRGLFIEGMSSDQDMRTGGADSVFTRTVTASGLEANGRDENSEGSVTLILNPNIMDRTDWYAYQYDQYGSTEESNFSDRQSPEQLFQDQKKIGFNGSNEQMFRHGIGAEQFMYVSVDTELKRQQVIQFLKENGHDTINGKPAEDFVVVTNAMSNYLELTRGEKPSTLYSENAVFRHDSQMTVGYAHYLRKYVIQCTSSRHDRLLLIQLDSEEEARRMYPQIKTLMEELDERTSSEDEKRDQLASFAKTLQEKPKKLAA